MSRSELDLFPKQVLKALNDGTAKLVINTQSKLSASSPVDSGRLASSWNVGTDQPDLSVRPEDWAEPGAGRVELNTPNPQTITFKSDHYISNNLPYASRAANDPGYVGRRGGGRGDWFSSVVNQLDQDAKRIYGKELGKI